LSMPRARCADGGGGRGLRVSSLHNWRVVCGQADVTATLVARSFMTPRAGVERRRILRRVAY
jgi:hypothetical protein